MKELSFQRENKESIEQYNLIGNFKSSNYPNWQFLTMLVTEYRTSGWGDFL